MSACTAVPGLSPTAAGVDARRRAAGEFSFPDGIRAGQSCTVEQCVAIALWNSPDYQTALADLGLARADIVKAGQITNPSLAALFPSDAKAFETAVKLPLDALWLRPQRMRIASLDAEATAARLMQAGADLARDVRVAAAKVLQVRRQSRLAGENAALFEEMVRIAGTRQKAGENSDLEVTQARADAALAAQERERLKYEETMALEKLRSLMGMARQPSALALSDSGAAAAPSVSVSAAVQEAIRSRPDVRAAELAVIAAGQRAGLAQAEILSLTASAKYTNRAGTQPGFDLQLPLFHQNQAARSQAAAQLDKALHQLSAARHRAAADAREATARLSQARAVASGWDKVLPELERALETARRPVTEGDAPPTAPLDAARRLAEARAKAAESEFRLREAAAECRRAAGKS